MVNYEFMYFLLLTSSISEGNGGLLDEFASFAVNITSLLVDDPLGSGNYSTEDLTIPPNTSLTLDVKFYYYSRLINGTQFNTDNLSSIDFDSSRKTIFIIHGWQNDYQSKMPQSIKDSYLEREDLNVVVTDWSNIALGSYVNSRYYLRKVGEALGSLIIYMSDKVNLKMDEIAMVGHSLGAHVAGIAGNLLNGTVDHLIGLDPAGPLFLLTPSDDKLSEDDAKFVQVVHSCAGLLGYPLSMGHADYWPNGGTSSQPGCGLDITGSCSHSRSWKYYYESMLMPESFPSLSCVGELVFNLGLCSDGERSFMGNDALDRSEGNFYLETNSEEPFGKGLSQQ